MSYRSSLILLLLPLFASMGLAAGEPTPSATPGAQANSPALTLADCYQRALSVNESLQINDETIRRLQAQYREGVGAVLPHIAWVKTQFFQDTSGVNNSTAGVQGTFLKSPRPESYFQFEQPLFSGFKDFNAIKGIKVATSQANHRQALAAQQLLADLANVFYTSLALQQSIDVLSEQRNLTNDRLKELQHRVSLGKSRDSEVLSDQVQLASLDAQIEETRRSWFAARMTLQFLTEIPPDVNLRDERGVAAPPTLEDAMARSAKRPDLLAADEARQISDYRFKYAKGGYYPTLGFLGKYYTERVGFQEDVRWDALFTLDVPLFQGFQTKARVAASRSDVLIAELEARRIQKQVRQEVQTAVRDLQYALSQANFYAEAVRLGERNYKIQQQEYRLGLINNLEVLQVMTTLQDLKLRKLQADAAVKLNDIRLRVAMGEGL